MSDGFKEFAKELEKEISFFREKARKDFVNGVYGTHKAIVQKFYTASPGSSVGLARRSGDAARSWSVQLKRSTSGIEAGIISAGVPYANMSVAKVITPKNRKWLTIPVGPALTKNGSPRYPNGPRQAATALKMPPRKSGGFRRLKEGSRDPLRFYKKDSNTAFLIAKDGVTGTGITKRNRILFVLKKRVTRPARTAQLMPFTQDRVDKIFKSMNHDVFASTGRK